MTLNKDVHVYIKLILSKYPSAGTTRTIYICTWYLLIHHYPNYIVSGKCQLNSCIRTVQSCCCFKLQTTNQYRTFPAQVELGIHVFPYTHCDERHFIIMCDFT